jgi:hypothetical protein
MRWGLIPRWWLKPVKDLMKLLPECFPVLSHRYVHPQFRYRSPKQRLRRSLLLALACLGVVGIAAAIMAPPSASQSDAADST